MHMPATSAPAGWPHHCHICTGTGLRVSFLASFGALTLEFRACPRRNIHNQHRRVWSTPSSTYIAAKTAPPPSSNPTDWASDGTYRAVPPSDPSVSSSSSSHVTVRRRCLLGPGTNSQTGRRRGHRVSCFRSPPLNIRNVLPRRKSCPSPCICRRQTIDTACSRPGTEEEADGAA